MICKKCFPESFFNVHQCTGAKSYECEFCKTTFRKSSHLAVHKRIHTGEKPHECAICKKAFISSSHFNNHNRIHTGEKPYSCNICQKSFSDKSTLSQHCKTSAHLKRKERKNIDFSSHENSFIDCGETIENIKEEINEEESVEDPLFIHQETEKSNICENIKEEVEEEESVDDPLSIQEENRRSENDNICTVVKEEGIDDDTLCVQEIHNSEDEENNTVGDQIDVVEHKIEIDN